MGKKDARIHIKLLQKLRQIKKLILQINKRRNKNPSPLEIQRKNDNRRRSQFHLHLPGPPPSDPGKRSWKHLTQDEKSRYRPENAF